MYVLLLPACACGEQNDVTLKCIFSKYEHQSRIISYESLNQPVRQ